MSGSCGGRGGRCCGESAFLKEAPAPGKQAANQEMLVTPAWEGTGKTPQLQGRVRQHQTPPGRAEQPLLLSWCGDPASTIHRLCSPGCHRFGDTVGVAVPCFSGSGVAHFCAGPGAAGAGAGAGQPGAPPGWPSLPTGPWAKSFNASVPPARRHYHGARQMDAQGRGQEPWLGAGSWIHAGSSLGLTGA